MSDYHAQYFLLFALLICASVAMLHNNRQVRIAELRSQLQRMEIVSALKKLLTQTQQHRGMVSAYLNGESSFQDKIRAQQLDIDHQIKQVVMQLKLEPQHTPQFLNIESQWKNLRSGSMNLTRDKSFENHIVLIRAILNMIRDVAEHSQLRKETGCHFSAIEIFWHLLPDAAEAIGQARGLGTGVAAAGRCQIVERIKLGYLVTRIGQALNRVESGIANTQSSMSANNAIQNAYSVANTQIANLIKVIEEQLLASEQLTIPPSSFFDIATGSLDSVFALYDQGEEITHKSLQHQFSEAQRKGKQSFFKFSITLVIVTVSLAHFWKFFPLQ